jgi:hypothetical protein
MQRVSRRVVACIAFLVMLVLAGASGARPLESHGRAFAADVDLTGVWRANDGGTYWIRQIGSTKIWWVGFSGSPDTPTMGRSFSNVFTGTIVGTTITGTWVDVPRGTTAGSGTLRLAIKGSTALVKTYSSGGFGGSIWRRSG